MKKTIPLLILLFLTCLIHEARATLIRELNLDQLVGRSDLIFIGRAIKASSHWTSDKRYIVTDTIFKIHQLIAGKTHGTEIVVRNFGGVVGGIGMHVAGTPNFDTDKPLVLFTQKRNGVRYVVGMRQGAFFVSKDADHRLVVRANLKGLHMMRGRSLITQSQQALAPQLLQDFIVRIHQTVRTCKEEKSRCQTR